MLGDGNALEQDAELAARLRQSLSDLEHEKDRLGLLLYRTGMALDAMRALLRKVETRQCRSIVGPWREIGATDTNSSRDHPKGTG